MPVTKADFMLVMGSNDLQVAEWASCLYHKGLAPLVICSGGIAHKNDLLSTDWHKPEATVFRDALIANAVPENIIYSDNVATNTAENIVNARYILATTRFEIASGLLVQKPFMERRALATAQHIWPAIAWTVTSEPVTFSEYLARWNRNLLINIIVGDMQRIMVYPKHGYFMPQSVPATAKVAFRELVRRGYREHLVSEVAAD